MSTHVGWISRERMYLESAGVALQASEEFGAKSGRSFAYYTGGLGTVSLVCLLADAASASGLEQSRRLKTFDSGDPNLLMVKGLLDNGENIADWFRATGLAILASCLCVAHVTAAEIVDNKLNTPGPAVVANNCIGAPVGAITDFVKNVIGADPEVIDVDVDSGTVFVEFVARLMGNCGPAVTAKMLAESRSHLHCSFVDLDTGKVYLINTRSRDGSKRLHYWESGAIKIFANTARAVTSIVPGARPVAMNDNEAIVLEKLL